MIKKKFFNICNALKLTWESSKGITIGLVILATLCGVITTINLYIGKRFIDSIILAINQIEVAGVMPWLIGLTLIELLKKCLERAIECMQDILAMKINNHINEIIIDKMNEMDLSFWDDTTTYDYIEKIKQDSILQVQGVLESCITLFKESIALIGIMVVISTFNPLIILISFMATIPLFWLEIKLLMKQYDIYTTRIEKLRHINYLRELFFDYSAIKEIKVFRIGDYLKEKIIMTYQKHIKEDKKIRKNFLKKITGSYCIEHVFILGIKVYIVIKSLKLRNSIGTISMYINAFEQLNNSTRSLINTITYLYKNNLYVESLFMLLECKPKLEKINEGEPFKKDFKEIEFQHVYFKYPNSSRYVLQDITIKIKAHTINAFVGLNGSGKTTLVKLLMRLYDPTEGIILIDGKDIRTFKIEDLYSNIGTIFQDFVKYPFTVKENIGLGNLKKIQDNNLIKNIAKKTNAEQFISQLPYGYETLLLKEWTGGAELSLGQWQKIALSRAYMSDAPILILDEPTAAIDCKAESEIFKHLKQAMKDRTSFVISHKFSTVKTADKLFVIHEGQVVEEGTHEQLLRKNGYYSELYHIQAEAYKE